MIDKSILNNKYVITDIPKDEELFVKICKLTGKQWSYHECHKDIYLITHFPCSVYVADSLLYGNQWDYEQNDGPKIHYKDFLKLFKEEIIRKEKVVVTNIPVNEVSIQKVVDYFGLIEKISIKRIIDFYKSEKIKFFHIKITSHNNWMYDRDLIQLKDFITIDFDELGENRLEENIKMKQVVLEIPNQKLEVTYKWLKEQKCCEPALDWFVNKFGNKASYEDVLKAARVERTDSNWLEERKQYLENKNKCDVEYVYANNVNDEKLYILKYRGNFYKATCFNGRYFFSDITKTENYYEFCYDLETIIKYSLKESDVIIYEFDSFDDFIDAYRAKKI